MKTEQLELPRLMIAAPESGVGKTIITCGLLQLLQNRDMNPAAFKCGPGFTDALLHRRVVGDKRGNLDLFFTDETAVRGLLAKGAAGCGIAVLDGVAGYYDGVHPANPVGSSYHIAKATGTPVVLVLNAPGASLSLAAQIYGFALFRPDANIKGVILNNCSEAQFNYLAPALGQNTGLPMLGYLPGDERYAIEGRHLNLVAAGEIDGLKAKMHWLAEALAQTVDIDRLLEIAWAAPALSYTPYAAKPVTKKKPRLALARDKAFGQYYGENLRMLAELGAELVEFSPLEDTCLPPDIQGLYLGGGTPQLYACELAGNWEIRAALQRAIDAGLPTVAECGGFLYLHDEIEDEKGKAWPMLGKIRGVGRDAGQTQRFGYITLTAERDTLYCEAGEGIRASESHRWYSTNEEEGDFTAEKPNIDMGWPSMVANTTLVAGFPQLYYPANPGFAANFVRAMAAFAPKTF